MKTNQISDSHSSTISQLVLISLVLTTSIMAFIASRLMWFEWFVPGRFGITDSTNLFSLLPLIRSGVVTQVGAIKSDGQIALTIGWMARCLVAFIFASSAWILIRKTHYGRPITIIILFPLLSFCSCGLLCEHLWVIDEVWLYQHESLPTITKIHWQGPFLLGTSVLIQATIIVYLIRKTAVSLQTTTD